MRLIAHRGNTTGPSPEHENTVPHVNKALAIGFDVEVDVWYVKGEFYLGHDAPTYPVEKQLLIDRRVWCHAKNQSTLVELLRINAHCFMHDQDVAALTSEKYIWEFSDQLPTSKSVIVMPEKSGNKPFNNVAAGICSDYVSKYTVLRILR
jgi:glycerophosphoryl diester phosphodiesterase